MNNHQGGPPTSSQLIVERTGHLSSSDITALSDRLSSAVTVNGPGPGPESAQAPGLGLGLGPGPGTGPAQVPGLTLVPDELLANVVLSNPQHLGLHKRGADRFPPSHQYILS